MQKNDAERRSLRRLLQDNQTWLHRAKALWFPLSLFVQEMALQVWAFGPYVRKELVFPLLFSLALGFVFDLFCSLWGEKANRFFSILLSLLTTVWFCAQTVYFTVFRTFLTLYSVSGAGQVLQFWREALAGMARAWVPLAVILLPFVLLCAFGRPFTPKARAGKKVLCALGACAAVFQFSGAAAVNLSDGGILSPRSLYYEDFVPQLAVQSFGAMTALRLDLGQLLFPQREAPVSVPTPPPTPAPAVTAAAAAESPEPTPTPIVYEPNVMDIDFTALAEQETDPTLQKMHTYFSSVEPTRRNEYTGRFEGKNLIWLTAEGFSRFAVDPVYTPTLYKLSHEGFVFENFYNPLWWVSTSDGEYVATTSLIPKPGVWSMSRSSENSMYFCMGNQLRRQGYDTRAYHDHTYSYYGRDKSHPNLGYDYKGLGNGLELTRTWPESDLEMMEVTVPEYVDNSPFHVYYMTVSGHLNYTFMGNSMAYKHKDDVSGLDMSEGPRAYIACQMELDLALENLLDQLEAAGELENTVICLSADHYPYGMEQSQLDELNGGPLDMRFDVYRSTLILWSGDMDEPVTVDKPCSSLDILPTLSNLFGVEYDSRLLMGRDVLSDAPGLVILSDRSFITDLGRYDSQANSFTPNEGAEVPEDYAKNTLAQVSDKFTYSKLILETDYYRKLGLDTDKSE